MSTGNRNVGSYYTGMETSLYIMIILNEEEDPDLYEEGLADASHYILLHYHEENFKLLLPNIFQRLSMYPNLTEEQHLAYIYGSEPKRLILHRLREEAIIDKAEVHVWLKEHFVAGHFEIDPILNELIKVGLVKVTSVKGIASDLLFMMNDLMISRIPSRIIFNNPGASNLPSSLIGAYKKNVIEYFQSYSPDDEDHVRIIDQVLLDPEVFEVFKLLRNTILTDDDLGKLARLKNIPTNRVLNILHDNQIITVLRDDQGKLYYGLLSDFQIRRFFPRYLLNIIREDYRRKRQNSATLITALDLMESEYYNYLKLLKKSTSKKGSKSEIATTV
jgi:hypothetical protein